MADSLIPDRDAAIRDRALTFAQGIAANQSVYMLSDSDVQTIVRAVSEFEAAYRIAADKLTRTQVTISEKDETRNAAVQVMRTYANIIRANQGISVQDKIAIGIKPRKRDMTPRKCPMTSPRLGFTAATPGQHTITFVDALSQNTRAKPFAATRMELYMALIDPDDDPPGSPQLPIDGFFGENTNWAWYVGSYTKSPIVVKTPNPPMARVAVYWGRWANHVGETGPWSVTLIAGWVGKMKMPKSTMDAKPTPPHPPQPAATQSSDAAMKLAA